MRSTHRNLRAVFDVMQENINAVDLDFNDLAFQNESGVFGSCESEMKKLKKAIQTSIGREVTLEGKLIFERTVRLDGYFAGRVESKEGTIIVGERGVVHADILVHTAIVSGEVRGNIRATDRIELYPPARVFGDLLAPVVSIDAGVVFKGNCSIKPKDDSAAKTAKMQSAPEQPVCAYGSRPHYEKAKELMIAHIYLQ